MVRGFFRHDIWMSRSAFGELFDAAASTFAYGGMTAVTMIPRASHTTRALGARNKGVWREPDRDTAGAATARRRVRADVLDIRRRLPAIQRRVRRAGFFLRGNAGQAAEDRRSDPLCDRTQTRHPSLALPGVEIIDIEVRAPTARLTLNAVNTTFASVTVDDGAAPPTSRSTPAPRPPRSSSRNRSALARTSSVSNSRRRSTNSIAASSSSIIRPTAASSVCSPANSNRRTRGGYFRAGTSPPSRRVRVDGHGAAEFPRGRQYARRARAPLEPNLKQVAFATTPTCRPICSC